MKQIFDFYKKKKTLSWLIIVITSYIAPTLLIIWISLFTYAFVKKVDLFSSKIDKKFNSKEWDKKMKNLNKDWAVKLKKIEKDWKKDPKKALWPMVGVFVGIIFIYNFISSATAKNFSKLSYIVYDCSSEIEGLKATIILTLDRNTMIQTAESETDMFPGKVTRSKMRITNWGKKKISVELLPKVRNKFFSHEPYFKGDKYYQQYIKAHGGDWFSTQCKIIEER